MHLIVIHLSEILMHHGHGGECRKSRKKQRERAVRHIYIYLRIELVEINIRACFILIYCKNNEIASCGTRPSSRVPFVSCNVNNSAHVDGQPNALSVIFATCNFANMARRVNTVLFHNEREDLNNCKLTFESFNVFSLKI